MGGRHALLLALLVIAAPLAHATDPLFDPVCPEDGVCVGPGTCTGPACVPRSCQPALHCRANLTLLDQDCEVNETIDGRTCQTYAGFAFRGGSAFNEGHVGVSLTNGSVDARHLPNTWIASSLDADLTLAGTYVGAVSAGAYHSRIDPQDGHEWREAGVFLLQDAGPLGGVRVAVGLWMLDLVPEDCFVRSSALDADCSTLETLP